ncbi:MAG: lactate racemase domain-containing protein, partial [Candidatus Eisenbacteria bacterium]|nr:lactate racemase domain-containing protein [Candidatus Eisenbacteria bacterium]
FHYFAGFGGGRKLVFPGLAEPSGILANHRRSLTAEGWPDPACEPGRLAGNPVHEDLVAAAALCPPHLLIQAYEPRPGADPVLEVGEPFASHEQACARYAAGHRIEHTQRPELLVADAGGTPRDATFLQAHKSLQHAARYLPDGGSLLLVAALEQGSGSESFQRLWSLEPGELARKAVESYELHTHTALALRCVTRRLEVAVLASPASPIVPEALSRAGIRAMVDPGEALRWIEERGRGRAWGWLARAEETLPERIGAEGGKRQPGLRQAEAAGEERR